MAKADRRLFRPLDLLFPLLPVLLCVGLCFYVGYVSEGSRRYVSFASGLGFLVIGTWGWYLSRYVFTHADYVTKHGIYVVLGKRNRPKKEHIEMYTEKCVDFWSTKSLQDPRGPTVIDRAKVLEAIRNVRCFCYDEKTVGVGYRLVRGIVKKVTFVGMARNNIQIIVPYWPDVPQHGVPGIFRHELSHIILGLNGFPPGGNHGETHHRIFSKAGLGV